MAIKGRDLRLKVKEVSQGITNYRTIGGERSCKLTIKCDSKEVASINSGTWKEFKPGRLSWSLTAFALLAGDPVLLRNYMFNRTTIVAQFVSRESGHTFTYQGNAIITDMEMSGEVKGKATFAITMKGTGALSFS